MSRAGSGGSSGAAWGWRQHRLTLLLCLLLVAAGLRIWGCFGQGLPYTFNSDEKGNVVRALRFGAEKTLDPKWFNKPALGYYFIFFEYGCYYLAGRAVGTFSSTEDFASHYFNDQAPFYLIGRITFSLLGAFTVLVTARLGRRLGGRRLGIASAMVLTVTLGHVASGQCVKMDVPAALFSTWALVAIVQVMRQGRVRDYVAAGVLAGLSMAIKYYGAGLLLPLLLAHLMRSPRARRCSPLWIWNPRLFASLGAFVTMFFLGSPYNFLNPMAFGRISKLAGKALQSLGLWSPGQIFGFRDMGAHADQGDFASTLEHLLGQLVSTNGIGPVVALLVVAGLVTAALRRRRGDVFLLIVFPYLVWLLAAGNPWNASPRHLVMLYPVVAVIAASGFLGLWSLATGWRRRARPWLAVVALGVLLALPFAGFPLHDTVMENAARAAEDPRLVAMRWIADEIPPGSVILNDGGALPLRENRSRVELILNRIQTLEEAGRIDTSQLYGSLRRQWTTDLRALDDYRAPTWDVLEMEHHWQAWKLTERIEATAGYSPLWMHSPWGSLFQQVLEQVQDPAPSDPVEECARALRSLLPETERDLAPVELWTRATAVSRPWLTSELDAEGRKRHRPVEWLVTTRAFVEEYQEPSQIRAFPDYGLFYEDLVAHYRCYQFPVPDPDHPLARMVTARIYDLRERFEDSPPPFIRIGDEGD